MLAQETKLPMARDPGCEFRKFEGLMSKVGANYPHIKRERYEGYVQDVFTLLGLVENPDTAQGKRVLDLGCGSQATMEHSKLKSFEPWLARTFHEVGADIIGIDIAEQIGEQFKSYRLDLSKIGALGKVFEKDAQFDYIICTWLINLFSDTKMTNSPSLLMNTNHEQRYEMRREIRMQAQRLLREGGLFLADGKDTFENPNKSFLLLKKEDGILAQEGQL